ncbi:DNA-binding MarR family transcriptional regulator [Streptococcus rupicaprae]|uniref:DNA-binding MarR family transcriptional regulator n=1 Tax=Streptococcus rupicaprae TaxID=759619 RepID=A0ABV2FES0_9STRE
MTKESMILKEDRSIISVEKRFARLRDDQFALYEHYARQRGMNYKGLLILLWLYNSPQGVSQKTLCDKTYTTKQVVYAIVQGYVEKGFVELKASQEDKRSKNVVLTPEGMAYATSIIAPLDAMEKEAMAQLSEQQVEMLLESTALFNHYLKDKLLP